MAHGAAREGKWRGNWRMEWVASTLHSTSDHDVSSITTADAHTSAASSRLNWRHRRFKWTRPFLRKTKSGFCTCANTFQTQSIYWVAKVRGAPQQDYFESKPAVRAVMCSAKSGNLFKYSWICLLLTYQVAPVTRRRHLDCNTCSLPTWMLEGNLYFGHAWAACTAVPHSWRRDDFSTGEDFIIT
jgi:hypothetical protein